MPWASTHSITHRQAEMQATVG